jgi:hypothetical protein
MQSKMLNGHVGSTSPVKNGLLYASSKSDSFLPNPSRKMGSELVFVHPHMEGKDTEQFDEEGGNGYAGNRKAKYATSPQPYRPAGFRVSSSSHQYAHTNSYRERQRRSPSDDFERRAFTGAAPSELLPKSSRKTRREVKQRFQYGYIFFLGAI